MDNNIDLSLLVPCYNEQDNLDYLFQKLTEVLDSLNIVYEIICINDGSKDNTLLKLIEYRMHNSDVKIINLSRNFGKEAAMTAGLDYAKGKAVIPIDADLQDPPELIKQFWFKWLEGYDVVYGVRIDRKGESWIKKMTSKYFYRFIGKISDTPIPEDTGDYRLMDQKVVQALKQMPERNRFMKGLFSWVGYKQTAIYFSREPRQSGKSRFNYWKLWNFAIDGITSFSSIPLKIWSYFGLIVSFLGLIYGSFLIIRTLISGVEVPGYASTIVTILFLGGIQLITLGILGEYTGRIYQEVKQRPIYLVQETYGFE
ncbi:glycosyltransferase family 2 protein [Cyanobacterium stanieri LEGE 03274]|uniref:Glycosyltransferase family 2 protein n=1 Tax=Cyanobacterium stanieri LEGE 03274 TaxID=1828756 RepID=A0ABR9V307_9CHRO|nr:glycosyltransferase family 2 protein [Cyanobacterium stanieri]MBE9222217.1 glycosyltransferase family 2 protein [Cyanobacterium stanieri LEGE 03274]